MIKVYIPGVWDLFHIGHLNVLKESKKLGDILIVGVCSDSLCRKTKKTLPTISEEWRMEVVQNIKCVDFCVVYRDLRYVSILETLGADIFAVGEDFGYMEEHKVAIEECNRRGIKFIKIPRYPNISSTHIKEKIKK